MNGGVVNLLFILSGYGGFLAPMAPALIGFVNVLKISS